MRGGDKIVRISKSECELEMVWVRGRQNHEQGIELRMQIRDIGGEGKPKP